ncbi:MAG: dephospho-CoA kinase [Balneolaceae bacterium]|nr:MAG: dephospho-CoA kinase [Balneolaceae bacterium]
MIVAGVTGGIGSGKTTLCKVWEELGARVVYADDLAKDLMVNNSDVRNKLIETFGEETFHTDGSLNKPHLIREAFENNRAEELNGIVHPAVARAFKKICSKAEADGEKIIVKEAALLLNKGRPEELDLVVLVTSPRSQQIDRVSKRDSVQEQEIRARINKQPDFESLKPLADYIVKNEGSLEEFKTRSKALLELIMSRESS